MQSISPQQSLEDIEAHILADLHGCPLTHDELSAYQSPIRFVHGWKINIEFDGGHHETIRVIVKEDFPFSHPVIAFETNERFLQWPHVEEDGRLCLFPLNATFDARDPVGVLKELLRQFVQYVSDVRAGKLNGDFATEFLSYWGYLPTEDALRVHSLLSPVGTSREIATFIGSERIICAETHAELEGWNAKFSGDKINPDAIRPGICIDLKSPPVPPFPKTPAELFTLIKANCTQASKLFEQVLKSDWQHFLIVMKANPGDGVGFIAVCLRRKAVGQKFSGTQKKLNAGFREGKIPLHLLVARSFGASARISHHAVTRVDHSWVHGRDQNQQALNVKNARVAYVGCGSLGAGVARLLAQSGLGHAHLIDGETLDWPNLSRHELGANSVGKLKAQRLAEHLKEQFPHLPQIGYSSRDLGRADTALEKSLLDYDLIVNTTGDWACDQYLAHLQATVTGFPPVLYAWLEPHALAAHAVLIKSQCASLLSGMTPLGVASQPVFELAALSEVELPGCAGTFSPYGAVALGRAQSMVAEAVLKSLNDRFRKSMHVLALERAANVAAAGAVVNPSWEAAHGPYPVAGGILELDWPQKAADVTANAASKKT